MNSIIKIFKKKYLGEFIKFLILSGILVFAAVVLSGTVSYKWQWYRVPKYLFFRSGGSYTPGRLLQGLAITLKISGISLILTFVIGLVTALFRLSHSAVARGTARVYLELIRNTPLLIQIFLIYFVIAPIFNFGPFFSAVLALSLFEGAYTSEIIRAGITGIPRSQWESSYSLGLNSFITYRKVILPQAIRQVLPPLTSQAISLIKDSALVSTIAIYDLTMQGQAIVSETFLSFEIWFTVAAIYLVLTLFLSLGTHILEKRLKMPGRERGAAGV